MADFAADWLGVLAAAVQVRTAAVSNGAGDSEVAALLTCRSFDTVGVGELGEVLGLTGSGAVRLVDRLERDGLITRRKGQAARSPCA